MKLSENVHYGFVSFVYFNLVLQVQFHHRSSEEVRFSMSLMIR